MQSKKFKPLVDRLFVIIWVPTLAMLIGGTALSFVSLSALILMLAVDAFTLYFLFSPLVGYAELRENTLFIKFGFISKREIPYEKIRSVAKDRRFYSESMLSLKNSLEHVNIKYNSFDLVCVSVVDNDVFLAELEERIAIKRANA